MNIGRLRRKDHPTAQPSRYAVVASGGSDPAASPGDSSLPIAAQPTDAAALSREEVAAEDPETAAVAQLQVELEDAVEHGLEALDPDELSRRKSELDEMIAMMRPAVQMDGGDLALVDVDYHAGIVEVELQGACGSCAISSTTLQGGVERLLKERLDWVTEVNGGVDDSVDPLESAALGRGAYVPRYY
jgi:Fe-S cluster biogenesis protein NfuA